jgi:SAM-dependent methyltransferase
LVRVLQSLDEVERAKNILKKNRLSYHGDYVKNWDLVQISEILDRVPREAHVLDMGCRGKRCSDMRFLYSKGIINSYGIDLSIPFSEKLSQIALRIKNRMKPPFTLVQGNLTKTGFKDCFFDVIICLSVIEHGVDLESFLKEAHRLLKNPGTLYVSTDYWEPKCQVEDYPKPFGLDWKIFSMMEIEELINLAKKCNFNIESEKIPRPRDKVIHWKDKHYTEISLIFEKQ